MLRLWSVHWQNHRAGAAYRRGSRRRSCLAGPIGPAPALAPGHHGVVDAFVRRHRVASWLRLRSKVRPVRTRHPMSVQAPTVNPSQPTRTAARRLSRPLSPSGPTRRIPLCGPWSTSTVLRCVVRSSHRRHRTSCPGSQIRSSNVLTRSWSARSRPERPTDVGGSCSATAVDTRTVEGPEGPLRRVTAVAMNRTTRNMLICSRTANRPRGAPVTAWVRSDNRIDRIANLILVPTGPTTRNLPRGPGTNASQ